MFMIENHGSVVLIIPSDEAERAWLTENVSDESQWWGGALSVEPRYVSDLCDGIVRAGFEVVAIY